MNVIAFEPCHVYAIDPQPSQVQWVGWFTPQYLENLSRMGPAYTALVDGRIMGCAGIIDSGFSSGLLWALVHKEARPHFVPMFRAVERLVHLIPLRRIEATVEKGFRPGCRALELLGFTCEGLMKKYGPDGQDHYRYAHVSS